MHCLKKNICIDIARFIIEHNIQCSVLNGVDPDFGKIGRDLDLYVPSENERIKLIIFSHSLLKRYGARWVVTMHPIWGDRCVGVWNNDYFYFELHTISSVNLGPVVASRVFGIAGKTGAYGLPFSPGMMFFKQVLNKKMRAILNGYSLWDTDMPSKFLLENRDSLYQGVAPFVCNGKKFINALLGEDSNGHKKLRRVGLISIIFRFIAAHPIEAFNSQIRSFVKKIISYFSPCAPSVSLNTTLSVCEVEKHLTQKLLGVFPKIIVTHSSYSWAFRKWMQARQQLFVFVANPGKKCGFAVDLQADIGALSNTDKELKIFCDLIMDKMLEMNAKWAKS